MRAIENRRWILRDTNNGVTASSIPTAESVRAFPATRSTPCPPQFAFRSDITFYTAHGDVFAWLCAILSIGRSVGPSACRMHPADLRDPPTR